MMPKVLAVADEVVEHLWTTRVRGHDVDLVLAAGDLPFDYLEFLSDALDRPCVFVPGNHDIDLGGYGSSRGPGRVDPLQRRTEPVDRTPDGAPGPCAAAPRGAAYATAAASTCC